MIDSAHIISKFSCQIILKNSDIEKKKKKNNGKYYFQQT